MRPVMPDGRDLTARAKVIHSGRRIAIAQARIENADAKPVALATGSSMFLTDRPASLGEAELAQGPDADDQ
jgi:acyl-coenzyme A thioesterase PaaI-like protein